MDADFDSVEAKVLEVSRYFWQTFAIPETQSWLYALKVAAEYSAFRDGCEFGLCVLSAVQAMRMSRKSCFHFNSPTCEGCAAIISDHERHYMHIFRAVRDNHLSQARSHAIILCEGNDTNDLIARISDLVQVIYSKQPQTLERSKQNLALR